jgi:uncharacterized membrane protein YfcA
MPAEPLVTPLAVAILALASFSAGLVDAIAGGGGLITVPALVSAGLPPHFALGTNKGQSVFGAVASALGYARRGFVDGARVPAGLALGFVGAILGGLAQLALDPAVLRPVVLVMLVGAAVLVAIPRRPHARAHALAHAPLLGALAALVFGAYDGFFGPGVGTMLLVANVIIHADSLTHASGNAKIVNLASNLAAFALFAWRGTIVWAIALPMAAANALGAWVGARIAVKQGDRLIRVVVLLVVAVLVAKLARDLRVVR